MVNKKRASNIYKIFTLQFAFLLKFIETVFFAALYNLATAPNISSHITTESPIILPKYLPLSKAHVERF